jgi:hypothetical protein
VKRGSCGYLVIVANLDGWGLGEIIGRGYPHLIHRV